MNDFDPITAAIGGASGLVTSLIGASATRKAAEKQQQIVGAEIKEQKLDEQLTQAQELRNEQLKVLYAIGGTALVVVAGVILIGMLRGGSK